MCDCFTCLYFCWPLVYLVPMEVSRTIRSPGSGVRGGCEPPCGCRESNLSPLNHWAVPKASSVLIYRCLDHRLPMAVRAPSLPWWPVVAVVSSQGYSCVHCPYLCASLCFFSSSAVRDLLVRKAVLTVGFFISLAMESASGLSHQECDEQALTPALGRWSQWAGCGL